MDKSINLYSIAQAYQINKSEVFDLFIRRNKISVKETEISEIINLVDKAFEYFSVAPAKAFQALDHFIISYVIPHLGKEMDMISLGENCIINIELKSESEKTKLENQLKQNYYYLNSTGLTPILYAYEEVSDSLFKYDNTSGTIEYVKFDDLFNNLINSSRKPFYTKSLDSLLSASHFLVSPFNATKNFLNGMYFLTSQQEMVKQSILNSLNGSSAIIAVKGGAGTGKSLLVYDIAKLYQEQGRKVLVVHCGKLNKGHSKLKESGWEITTPKFVEGKLCIDAPKKYDLIVVDEAQRIHFDQYNKLLDRICELRIKCIFSYDKKQCMKDKEYKSGVVGQIIHYAGKQHYELTNKIRSNAAVANFIDALFEKKIEINGTSSDNVEVVYCDREDSLKELLRYYESINITVPIYTPSPRTNNKDYHEKWNPHFALCNTAHDIIGQEFDSVATVLGPNINYKDGKLVSANSSYYDDIGMLYQILTRAKTKIHLIVYQNIEMYVRCLEILRKGDDSVQAG